MDARQKILVIQTDIFNLRRNTNFAQTYQIQRVGAGIYLGVICRYGFTIALIERKQRVYVALLCAGDVYKGSHIAETVEYGHIGRQGVAFVCKRQMKRFDHRLWEGRLCSARRRDHGRHCRVGNTGPLMRTPLAVSLLLAHEEFPYIQSRYIRFRRKAHPLMDY